MGVSRTVLLAAAVVASLMEGVQPWSVPVARPTVAPRGLRARACSLRAPQSPPSAARRSCVGLRMAGARALLRRVLLGEREWGEGLGKELEVGSGLELGKGRSRGKQNRGGGSFRRRKSACTASRRGM